MRKYIVFYLMVLIAMTYGCSAEYSAERLYFRAEKLAQTIIRDPQAVPTGQFEEAINAFQEIIAEYPGTNKAAESRFMIGELYLANKDYEKARVEFSRVMDNYSNITWLCANAQFSIGLSYECEGNWDKAFPEYQKVADTYPATPQGLRAPIYIAQYFVRSKDNTKAEIAFKKATVQYEKIITEHPNPMLEGIALDYIAMSYSYLKNWEDAIEALKSLIEHNPDGPKAPTSLLTIGAIYEDKLSQPKKAQEIYQDFINKYPRSKIAEVAKKKIDDLHSSGR